MARKHWKHRHRLLAVLVLGCALPASAAVPIREIPNTWSPTELHRLPIEGVEASSWVRSAIDQYAPARAVDGNRGTKWAASVAPTPAAPQWITLDLFSVQRVSAVAVFGGADDNIRDAQIQVSRTKGGPFTTVAAIDAAAPVNWLAAPPFGLFVMAMLVPWATWPGTLVRAACGIAVVAAVNYWEEFTGTKGISFLWAMPLSLVVQVAAGSLVRRSFESNRPVYLRVLESDGLRPNVLI